jgi:hypothetical protein
MLEKCAASGEDINSRGEGGCTALHFAADRGHLAVVQWLIRHGADLDAQDDEGQAALHYAAMCEQHEVSWPGLVLHAWLTTAHRRLVVTNGWSTCTCSRRRCGPQATPALLLAPGNVVCGPACRLDRGHECMPGCWLALGTLVWVVCWLRVCSKGWQCRM